MDKNCSYIVTDSNPHIAIDPEGERTITLSSESGFDTTHHISHSSGNLFYALVPEVSSNNVCIIASKTGAPTYKQLVLGHKLYS